MNKNIETQQSLLVTYQSFNKLNQIRIYTISVLYLTAGPAYAKTAYKNYSIKCVFYIIVLIKIFLKNTCTSTEYPTKCLLSFRYIFIGLLSMKNVNKWFEISTSWQGFCVRSSCNEGCSVDVQEALPVL